jgi:hypothetical protein
MHVLFFSAAGSIHKAKKTESNPLHAIDRSTELRFFFFFFFVLVFFFLALLFLLTAILFSREQNE